MNNTWIEIKEILNKSKRKIVIYENELKNGQNTNKQLDIPEDSILTSVITNYNGIFIDNWIRVLGQGNDKQKGVLYYNTTINDICLNGMFIIANDVIGGIYAINISRFENERNIIWYFAPDTLEWESLEMKYLDFIIWTMQGDIDEFYESMRWQEWKNDCKEIEFNMGYLIYPFLWTKECNINIADKKIVPFDELMKLNFDFTKKM